MKINENNKKSTWQIHHLGDHAILFSLKELIDVEINNEVHAFNHFIQTKNINAFNDFIPAYHSLTIVYDIVALQKLLQKSIHEFAQDLVNEFEQFKKENNSFSLTTNHIKVPVCYELDFGIDLAKMAKEKNCSVKEIIEIHSSKSYQVFCIGFQPGFAYMGKVDEKIQVPRHAKPRPLVSTGSVGIAGAQTGIYPKDAPGGWQIIGRTPLIIFDPVQLALFAPGDTVSFYPISLEEFYSIQKETNHVI
jgi:inhibitor of KinA